MLISVQISVNRILFVLICAVM